MLGQCDSVLEKLWPQGYHPERLATPITVASKDALLAYVYMYTLRNVIGTSAVRHYNLHSLYLKDYLHSLYWKTGFVYSGGQGM
jgi:hypothetical protein